MKEVNDFLKYFTDWGLCEVRKIEKKYKKKPGGFQSLSLYSGIIKSSEKINTKLFFTTIKGNSTVTIIYDFEKDTFEILNTLKFEIIEKSRHWSFLLPLYKAKVINNPEESIRLFRTKFIKLDMWEKSLLNDQKYEIYDYLNDYICKVDNVNREIIVLKTEDGRILKFLRSELEIISPDIVKIKKIIHNYNPPKDRSFQKGKIVKIKDDRRTIVKKDQSFKIENIYNSGTKRYAELIVDNQKYAINVKKLKII